MALNRSSTVDELGAIAAKEAIRELVLLYSRAINRKDFDLLESLYTADATDSHGRTFYPTVQAFVSRLREVVPAQRNSSLFVCNHLIDVSGNTGEGEVYAHSHHFMPEDGGVWIEHQMRVRYIDKYRRESGRWLFASRTLVIDHHALRPTPPPEREPRQSADDPSYTILSTGLFRAGPRA
jgi:SnoaL-like domain